MKKISIIIKELKALAASDADKDNLKKIEYYFKKNKYLMAGNAAKKFAEKGIVKSKYQKKLQDLVPLISVSTKAEAEKRINHLFALIEYQDDALVDVKLSNALDAGVVVALNNILPLPTHSPYQGRSPLLEAIKLRRASVVKILVANGANLHRVKNINKVINENDDTLLHLACELGLDNVVVELLLKGADLNKKNKKGETPLFTAIKKGNHNIVGLLLNKKVDLTICKEMKGNIRMTPFQCALFYRKEKIAEMIAAPQFGYQFDTMDYLFCKEYYPDLYTQIKQPIKQNKKEIIGKGSAATMFSHQKKVMEIPGQIQSILKNLFIADQALTDNITLKLIAIYENDNGVLKPLLDLVALACEGHHLGDAKRKQLRIIVAKEESVKNVSIHGESLGAYNNRNTIYMSSGKLTVDEIVGGILHEAKHFSDRELFKEDNVPCSSSHMKHFLIVKNMLKERCEKVLFDSDPKEYSEQDIKLYKLLYSPFIDYTKDKQNIEVLVRVPQIIGELGNKRGVSWLQKHEPALLAFYKFRFNNSCKMHVKKLQQAVESKLRVGVNKQVI